VHIAYVGTPKKRDKKNEKMARKIVKARSLAVILLFALTACIIGVKSTGTAYAVSQPTIPPCTLNIVAVTAATGNTTLQLTNNTIANYIQAGNLTQLSGNANMTNEPTSGATKWYMDQYRGVSILGLVNLVCQLQSNSTVTLISAYDGYTVIFNYTYIAQGQINTYTNTSALTYNSGGFWTGTSGAYSMVAHNTGESLTAIIAYYINPVSGGNNSGPTAFAGWQPLATTGSPQPGPLRNVVLGCANHHYTYTRPSDQDVGEIIIHNPGPITLPRITKLTVSPSFVMLGGIFTANATVHNGLTQTATYNISVYANKTVIGKTTGINIAAGANTTQTFTWNTTSAPYGNYIITAQLSGNITVSGNKCTFSASYTGSTVLVTLAGDFNGDRKVDSTDFVIFLAAYGFSTGQPAYNSACDLNHDGIVNYADFVIFLANYGKSI
jgi:hypothetical protein